MSILIASHPYQHLVLLIFWIPAVAVGMKWSLEILVCIFPKMTDDTEHVFMHLLTHLASSFCEVSVEVFWSFVSGFFFLITTLQRFFLYPGTSPSSNKIRIKFYNISWLAISFPWILFWILFPIPSPHFRILQQLLAFNCSA